MDLKRTIDGIQPAQLPAFFFGWPDVVCDEELRPFYERLGLKAGTGIMRRNYANQSGAAPSKG